MKESEVVEVKQCVRFRKGKRKKLIQGNTILKVGRDHPSKLAFINI